MVTEDGATLRVLDATYELIAKQGLRGVTMNQVATEAGLGVATVYRRFPRKAVLIRAVLLREMERLVTVVSTSMDSAAAIEVQAADAFEHFARTVTEHPFLIRLLRNEDRNGGEAVTSGDLVDQGVRVAQVYLAGWLRDIQAEGRYLSVDADIVAELEARLAMSLILSPDGRIPMHDAAQVRDFAARYLVPLLGPE